MKLFTFYGYITNSQSDQLPDGLIAQSVEHCTGIAEVVGSGLNFLRSSNIWSIIYSFALLLLLFFYGLASRQLNGAQNFRQLTHVKRHVPNRSETSGSVSWIFAFGGNLFSSLCGILDLKSTSVTQPISPADLTFMSCIWFTGMQNDLQFCWRKPAVIFHVHQVYEVYI